MKTFSLSCLLLWGCNNTKNEKITVDDITSQPENTNDTDQDTDSSFLEPDILKVFYLLEQSNTENKLWLLNVETKDYSLLGTLDCPFTVYNDKLSAMTADPKGILWALSEEYEIMKIVPATLNCTAFPKMASTEAFQAESLAFLETSEGTAFYLAGYYTNPQGFSSTALAKMDTNGISIIASISNISGQDTVIDIDTTPDQRLFGYRGWGNLSELIQLSPEDGSTTESQSIYISTAQNFALLSDNQSHWFFTNTGPSGSQLHRLYQGEWEWWVDLPFTVVGASGIE